MRNLPTISSISSKKKTDHRRNLWGKRHPIQEKKKAKKPKTMITTGTMHMCFTVSNIEKIFHKLKKNKIFFFSPPLKSIFDPVTTCFCYDPDYNLVQFVQGKQVGPK